ncbi:UNVERIFIED_CONTAM: hypothetical protein PYX00_009910 [Menopon gallinae]|uniref:Protein-tyrosine-phosphatase n=1 Tax=Menopon gallinae TaxID=328185 RepID=A0AAW2HDG7_9NEOP
MSECDARNRSKLQCKFNTLLILLLIVHVKCDNTPFVPDSEDSYEPSKPLNLTVIKATSTKIELSWAKPEHENGDLKGYRIYFIDGNYTDVRSTRGPVLSYTLDGLKPYTEYKIWVKAYTLKNEGMQSDSVRFRTDVAGPSPPIITNLTCQSNNTIFIEWKRPRPSETYNSVDHYFIMYKSTDSDVYEERAINASEIDNITDTFQVLLTNLTTDTLYEVQLQAGTRSTYREKELIRGLPTGTRTISVKPDCDKYTPLLSQVPGELSAGMIAGLLCVIVAILVALFVLVIWKKCFRASYYYLDDPTALSVPTACDWDQQKENGVNTAIPIHLFAKHVAGLHADGDIGFSKEYETIQNSCTEGHTVINSQLPDNKMKNRYLNILAYDHTRVHLLPLPGQKKSTEYLNANYIDGFQRSRAYIGTQGPLPATFNCFWRMVWEQRVAIIVMITNLIERGRRKCDMYWPKEGTEVYGVISVTMVKEDIMATYTIRTFQIRHLRIKKKKSNVQERTVLQYHYTNWPDHGTPDHPLPILRFVSKSSAANPPDAGPIIVHCSAGVGRTGAYIVLDAMLKEIKAKREVNIYGFLRHIRTQRNFLVQTEEQYVFIHDALVEAIESGETNIHQGYLSRYLSTIVANPQCDKSLPGIVLDNQYKLVTAFRAEDYNMISARKPINMCKNRNNDIVPMECFRVHLTPKPGVDGSDYINATWLIGFHKMREFIITQTPLSNTVMDFWQMVWDHSAQTVVMLTNTENQELEPFWPSEQNVLEGENYKVKLVVESEQNGCIMRDFTLQSAQDDYDLPVRIFHYPSWPHSCSPLHHVFDLIRRVQEWNKETQHGPIIVIDRYGGNEAATFCLLTSVSKQLAHEGHVDIYMYAKLYHIRRPGIWPEVNDYLFLYEAIEALANSSGFTSGGGVTPTPVGLGPTPDIYISSNGHINGYVRFDSENGNETAITTENGFVCGENGFERSDSSNRVVQGNGNVSIMNSGSIEDNLHSAQ